MRVVRSVLTHGELTQDSSLVEDSMMDSLALTELIAQLNDAVGPHVDQSVLFSHPTVRSLASLLRSKQPSLQQRGGAAARRAVSFDKETQTPGIDDARLLVEQGTQGAGEVL